MPRRNAATEDAIMFAVEQATEWAFRGGWFGQQAYGVYYGAWAVSLRLGCEIADPGEWAQWVREAIEDLSSRSGRSAYVYA